MPVVKALLKSLVTFSTDESVTNPSSLVSDYQSRHIQALINDREQSRINPDIQTDKTKQLKPQRIKRQNPQSRVSGGKANYDGDLGVYVPDYRPSDGSILTSTPLNFPDEITDFYPELTGYSGKSNYLFIRKLSDLYRYAGYTCPHIYMRVNGIETKIAKIRMIEDTLSVRFIPGLPVPLVTRVTNWVSSFVLEDIGTLYPVMGGISMKYRASVDCLESIFLDLLGIDRALVYAATDCHLFDVDSNPINLCEVLDSVSRYGNTAEIIRFGALYLKQDENYNVIVSRLQFKPRQFIYDWLLSHPIAPNRSIAKDSNPVTGKAANRKYNRAQKDKKYGKGKVTRG
jgi:hypothetical protein